MGIRAVAVLPALLALGPLGLAPTPALATDPSTAATGATTVLITGDFALNIENLSRGFRLHPRVAFHAWQRATPAQTEGTVEVGLFGGWSCIPVSFVQSMMLSGDGTVEGTGANHVLLLASVGHSFHTATVHGHSVQLGFHLLGGWANRSERARISYDRYGIDASYQESVHGALAGFLTTFAVLFKGRAGPAFESCYYPLTTHRGLANWHLGLGVALRLGPLPG